MPTARRIRRIDEVLKARDGGLAVVLEDIHDPHNAEAILRTCDAFGVQHAYFIFEKEKRYNPRRIGKTTSSSANKWLAFHIYASTEDCIKDLKRRKYAVIATSLDSGAEDIYRSSFREPRIALLFGNEHAGVSAIARRKADRNIKIPMRGMVESLNVSVSAGIFLYAVAKGRARAKTRRRFSPGELRRLRREFSAK